MVRARKETAIMTQIELHLKQLAVNLSDHLQRAAAVAEKLLPRASQRPLKIQQKQTEMAVTAGQAANPELTDALATVSELELKRDCANKTARVFFTDEVGVERVVCVVRSMVTAKAIADVMNTMMTCKNDEACQRIARAVEICAR